MTEAPSIWWYGVNSLFAPRTAARRLIEDERLPAFAWKLVAMGLLALFAASFVINALADVLSPSLMVANPSMFGLGLAGRLLEAALYAGLTYLFIRIVIYVWFDVLKYREPPFGVLAATSLTAAVMLLLSPLQELFYIAVANVSPEVGTVAFVANFAFVLALTASYYSETLGISYGKAVLRSLAVLMVVIVVMALILLLTSFLIWSVAGSVFSPVAGG